MTTGAETTADTCNDTAKIRWKLDVLTETVERIRMKACEIGDATLRVCDIAMKAVGARGPDPDFEPETEVERIARLVAREAARTAVEVGTYNEGGGGPWQNWMLVLCGGLALAGIVGGVLMYGQLSAIEANQQAQASQLARMQNQIDWLITELRRK